MRLPEKFFIHDNHNNMTSLVTLSNESYTENFYWIQEDYTHENYDPNWDTSGTIRETTLLKIIKEGQYTIVPEGWINLEEV